MAYGETLAARIREMIGVIDVEVTGGKMFGGLAFMLNGHMFTGVVGDELMLRLGHAGAEAAPRREHVREMDFTGRPMKAMVFVEPAGLHGDRARPMGHRRRRLREVAAPEIPLSTQSCSSRGSTSGQKSDHMNLTESEYPRKPSPPSPAAGRGPSSESGRCLMRLSWRPLRQPRASAWSLGLEEPGPGPGPWRARQAWCGRWPVAGRVVTDGVIRARCRMPARRRVWPGRWRAEACHQLMLARITGRSARWTLRGCWRPGRRAVVPDCPAAPAGSRASRVPGRAATRDPALNFGRKIAERDQQACGGDPFASVIIEAGCSGSCHGYMEWASYTRTLSMIGMSRTSDSASSRLSALRMQ